MGQNARYDACIACLSLNNVPHFQLAFGDRSTTQHLTSGPRHLRIFNGEVGMERVKAGGGINIYSNTESDVVPNNTLD